MQSARLGILLLSLSLNLKGDEQTANLVIWVHGTTLHAVLPSKWSGKQAGEVKMIHFAELRPDSEVSRKALALAAGDSENFSTEYFYLCKWSGFLSHAERMAVAQQLYTFLLETTEKLAAQGKVVRTTIIGHSHGGNIALGLGMHHLIMDHLLIDRLVLLACPVQERTAVYLEQKLFKKVYAFYSYFDPIQVLDLQWFARLSGRKFKSCEKLVQIQARWKHCGLFHNDFKTVHFVETLPGLLKKIDAGELVELEPLTNLRVALS